MRKLNLDSRISLRLSEAVMRCYGAHAARRACPVPRSARRLHERSLQGYEAVEDVANAVYSYVDSEQEAAECLRAVARDRQVADAAPLYFSSDTPPPQTHKKAPVVVEVPVNALPGQLTMFPRRSVSEAMGLAL